jgi:hypothetical protein
MAFVRRAEPLARRRERLTGTGACPDGPVVGPSGKSKSVRPDADSGEEMALDVSVEIGGLNIGD